MTYIVETYMADHGAGWVEDAIGPISRFPTFAEAVEVVQSLRCLRDPEFRNAAYRIRRGTTVVRQWEARQPLEVTLGPGAADLAGGLTAEGYRVRLR